VKGPDQTLDLGDVTLAVDDRGGQGQGSRPATPLVLLHGFTGGRNDFADVVDELAADRRVVAWDHRGHNDSTNTGDPSSYTIEQLRDDAWRALDALDIHRFHLLGHSMGGLVVQLMAVDRPERVASLILMDTSPHPMRVPREWVDRFAEMGRTEGMRAVADSLAELTAGYSVAPEADQQRIADRNHAKLVKMDVEAYVAFAEALRSWEPVLADLAATPRPTTVLVGELDQPFREPSEVFASSIPGAELVVIDGAAHCPQEDRRSEWLAAVHSHLSRAERAD
jgi:pimeloyl-ACP methyl ester carboxylesterase